MLVVWGQVAFDNSLAIVHAFPEIFPERVSPYPSPILLVKALLLPLESYPDERTKDVQDAVKRLNNKSRSFSLASSVFEAPQ